MSVAGWARFFARPDRVASGVRGFLVPGQLWRNEPPEQQRVHANPDIEHREHPQRERPKDDSADPFLNHRVIGSCCLTRAREKIAFPNRKKAGLPEHGLKGDEGKSAEVQSAPPEDADKSPGAPRSQRNHDQTKDIERDHGHVGPEDRRGRSRKQLMVHFTGRVISTGFPRETRRDKAVMPPREMRVGRLLRMPLASGSRAAEPSGITAEDVPRRLRLATNDNELLVARWAARHPSTCLLLRSRDLVADALAADLPDRRRDVIEAAAVLETKNL